MNPNKKLKGLILTFLIILSLPCSAFAMNFDAESLYNSIFVVNSGMALGSGFAIGENCILTNAHVIDSDASITVDTYDGNSYEAQLLIKNDDMDLAVLYVDSTVFKYLTIGNDSDVKIGDDVFAIGAPESLDYTLTKGILSSKNRMVGDYSYIQANIALNHGNSGGPLLNSNGEVIGINTMTMQGVEGIGFAIPISVAIEYIKSNGIAFNSNGNVDGIVTDESKIRLEDRNDKNGADDDQSSSNQKSLKFGSLTAILILALVLILLISGLVIFFVLRKNRTEKKELDPTERTDFEIEIEE